MSETLQTIRSWPDTDFQNNLAKLDNHTKPGGPCAVTTIKLTFDAIVEGENILFGTGPIGVFRVGSTTRHGLPVYAWRHKQGFVKFVHYADVPPPKANRFIVLHDDTDPEVTLAEPFCWVKRAHSEALVHYFYLARGQIETICAGTDSFRERFLGACGDVAEHITRAEHVKAAAEHCVRSSESTSNFVNRKVQTITATYAETESPQAEESVPQIPNSPRAPTSASASQPDTMDQAFTTFKAAFMDQMSAAQAANRHEIAELTTQVSSLERKLADAEVEHSNLEKSLAVAKDEAAKWKAQHERLLKAVKGISDSHS